MDIILDVNKRLTIETMDALVKSGYLAKVAGPLAGKETAGLYNEIFGSVDHHWVILKPIPTNFVEPTLWAGHFICFEGDVWIFGPQTIWEMELQAGNWIPNCTACGDDPDYKHPVTGDCAVCRED